MLAFAICVPNVFIFVESLLKSMFGNKAWPTFGTIFVVRKILRVFSQRKLNVCFLLKHNIGDCIVHLYGLEKTVLFWRYPNKLLSLVTIPEYENVFQQDEAREQAGEDQCDRSGYNRRLRATQSPNE